MAILSGATRVRLSGISTAIYREPLLRIVEMWTPACAPDPDETIGSRLIAAAFQSANNGGTPTKLEFNRGLSALHPSAG